ncbi:MAG: hypothetical protein HOP33_10335 [Verrucomicrobia bacterium]|nr:hypothetical protein [Verrucomicrobiota bacterium]
MKSSVISTVRVLRVAGLIFVLLASATATLLAQTVTIDYNFHSFIPPNSIPVNWKLPWHEDGFTTARIGGAISDALLKLEIPKTGDSPPYSGTLFLTSNGSTASSVLVTNDSLSTFDFRSLDIVGIVAGTGSATNLARITSSAGGTYDLFGTPNGTTLSFSDVQWEGLSFVKVEFLSSASHFPGSVELDNFVVQPNAVPEPSYYWFVAFGLCGWFGSKSKVLR